MIEVKKRDWNEISKDYKGKITQEMINNSNYISPQHLGKRQVFEGCINKNGGTTIVTEGIDIIIV